MSRRSLVQFVQRIERRMIHHGGKWEWAIDRNIKPVRITPTCYQQSYCRTPAGHYAKRSSHRYAICSVWPDAGRAFASFCLPWPLQIYLWNARLRGPAPCRLAISELLHRLPNGLLLYWSSGVSTLLRSPELNPNHEGEKCGADRYRNQKSAQGRASRQD